MVDIGLQAIMTIIGLGWKPCTLDGYREAAGLLATPVCKRNVKGEVVSPLRVGVFWHKCSRPSNTPFYGIIDRTFQQYGVCRIDEEGVGPVIRSTSMWRKDLHNG